MTTKLAPLLVTTLLLASAFTTASALEIRTAAQDSQPKFVKDANGVSGLCIDIFKAIERTDPGLMKERIRTELRKYVKKRTGRRPLVVPVVIVI